MFICPVVVNTDTEVQYTTSINCASYAVTVCCITLRLIASNVGEVGQVNENLKSGVELDQKKTLPLT